MRIVQLTPGTGSFYCGTCMRDNALVSELVRQGHDAVMAPMYLHPALDEHSATSGLPVFYGGINVFLQQKSRLFRKTPRWIDQLFDADTLLKSAAKQAGSTKPQDLGELTVSTLRGEEGNQAKELERLCDWLSHHYRPDVIMLSNILLIGLARRLKQTTGAAMVCTLQGEDYFLDDLGAPHSAEAWAVITERAKDIDRFVAVSGYYSGVMCRRAQLVPDRVAVVHNGIDLRGYGPPAEPPATPTIGYLARMCSLKGLDTLVSAFILLRERGRVAPNLRIAGTKTAADEAFVTRELARLKHAGLQSEAEFLPNISREEKISFLQSLSVLSVPATYGESFGLYLLEAMACGVPVVQPMHGAFPEVLAATGGGSLYEGDGPEPLANALEEMLLNDPDRQRLGAQGMASVHERFGVDRMAREVASACEAAIGTAKSGA